MIQNVLHCVRFQWFADMFESLWGETPGACAITLRWGPEDFKTVAILQVGGVRISMVMNNIAL